MEKHGVVPDLIPAAPKETIEIKYGDVSLNLGDELTPTQVKVCIKKFLRYIVYPWGQVQNIFVEILGSSNNIEMDCRTRSIIYFTFH